ncbi:MAG: acyltransferase [Knoellia sp.]
MSGEPSAASLPALTGARWLAALAVFLHHAGLAAYLSGGSQRALLTVGGAGHVGVSFFFILSGFVLLWSHRPGEGPRSFWRRRVARVVPLHLATAVVALLLGLTIAPSLGPRAETGGWGAMVANAALVGSWVPGWSQAGNPVSWSLACEAFFYALFPAVVLLVARGGQRRAWTCLGLAAVCALVAALLIDALTVDLSRVPLTRLPEFVAGVATARLVRLGAWPVQRLGWALLLAAGGWVLASLTTPPYAVALATLTGFVALIGALGWCQSQSRPGPPLARWLSRPRMVRLGEWSFAFYLVHILVMRVIEHTLVSHPALPAIPGLALLLVVLMVSIALAGLVHHGVEAPMNAWIRARGRQRVSIAVQSS